MSDKIKMLDEIFRKIQSIKTELDIEFYSIIEKEYELRIHTHDEIFQLEQKLLEMKVQEELEINEMLEKEEKRIKDELTTEQLKAISDKFAEKLKEREEGMKDE